MTGIGWIYAIFLLLKRLLLSATLEFTEGAINASMSLTLQSLDSALLLLLRPYSDAQATASEALAGLGDLSAYLAISLPVLFGPSVYIGDLPTLILASWGVLVKLCTSVMESVAGALSTVFLLARALQAAFPGVFGEALMVVAEEAQGAGEEAQGAEGSEKAPVEEVLRQTADATALDILPHN
jgi:hypothetical protein